MFRILSGSLARLSLLNSGIPGVRLIVSSRVRTQKVNILEHIVRIWTVGHICSDWQVSQVHDDVKHAPVIGIIGTAHLPIRPIRTNWQFIINVNKLKKKTGNLY